MDNGRKGLPYAPYLMFVIAGVIGRCFDKDGLHTVYRIEKTRASGAGESVRHSSVANEDIPESSRSASRRGKKKKCLGKWIKAIFATYTYAAKTAYEDWLENHETRQHVDLPALPRVEPLLRFDNLPSLSDTDSGEEEY